MKQFRIVLFAAVCALLASCSVPKNITYMQGFENGQTEQVAPPVRITVQPDDKLAIVVTSKDPELAVAFNLAIAQYRIGMGSNGSMSESSGRLHRRPQRRHRLPADRQAPRSGTQSLRCV